jgi:hypothetical protein
MSLGLGLPVVWATGTVFAFCVLVALKSQWLGNVGIRSVIALRAIPLFRCMDILDDLELLSGDVVGEPPNSVKVEVKAEEDEADAVAEATLDKEFMEFFEEDDRDEHSVSGTSGKAF